MKFFRQTEKVPIFFNPSAATLHTMLNSLLAYKNIKPILLSLAIGVLAYQVGKNTPRMLTISLGTWMQIVFSILPGFALVIFIALWDPSEQRLTAQEFPPIKALLPVFPVCVLFAFVIVWVSGHFPLYTIAGQVLLFGSMGAMFFLGVTKPELGPSIFFALYPLLMFVEARLNFTWGMLAWLIPNIPEWLQATVFGLEGINVVLFMFATGFLVFGVRQGKQIERTMLDKPIILLLIWTFMSIIMANDFLEGLRSYLVKWVFPTTIYYATFSAIKRTNGIREIQFSLIALLFLSCLLSIQNAALTGETLILPGERAKIWTVIAGQMGAWTVLALPLALCLVFDRKETIHIRAFSVVTVILSLTIAIWEMQRRVMINFAVIAVLGFLLYHRRWRWYMVFYSILGILAFLFLDKIIELFELFRPSLTQENPFAFSANLDRLYLWEEGWKIVRNYPYLGIGPGGFRLLHIGLLIPEISSHNMLLEVAIESGFIASVLFATILFAPIAKFTFSFAKGTYQTYSYDIRPWIISLAGYSVSLMFHTNWSWGYGAAVFCILGVVVRGMTKDLNQAHFIEKVNNRKHFIHGEPAFSDRSASH